MTEEIPLFEIPWDETDISNAVESLSRGSYWAKGPFVDEFEAGLESYLGIDHAVSTNSGTTALVAALKACDVGPGDEVIVPSFTFIATANVVKLVGAEPVFADIELDTFGLDPQSVAAKLTDDTAAILPVHVYGTPCRIHELHTIAKKNNLWLIEDTAEAFGATADDDLAGTVGDIAALSFCQNKILPTGEGGAIISDDPTLAKAASKFCNHGRVEGDYFGSVDSGTYETVGSNYRMSDMVAAVGVAQLSKVDDLIESRKAVAERYHEGFSTIEAIKTHQPAEGNDHVYQLYSVLFEKPSVRSHVVKALTDRNISCKVYWDPPAHEAEVYAPDGNNRLPQTMSVSRRVLSIPMYPTLQPQTVDRIVRVVCEAITDATS